ncbi:MAG: bifunctional transaldolase/phosoglucose isomerase [Acidobacteria bacterium]|nr:bifunctional transaldolase/phosoglucose isomerase [Acidobacteriota bacterium]
MATLVERQNPLLQAGELGQSIWLDYIRRSLITSGELQRLITQDGLCGLTSNPSIFEKAIAGSTDYQDILSELNRQALTPAGKFERIAIRDIRDAAGVMAGVYRETGGRDGYVSMEVSPLLARDTEGTVAEARRLWSAVDRPNLMIKVPGTAEGVPAIEQLISEGINVNVTLLFAQQAYAEVAEAFIRGLEKRAAAGGDISRLASVASFFVSRIDTSADKLLEAKIKAAADAAEQRRLSALQGQVAIANAKQAYRHYEQLCASERWQRLAARGAMPQRLLWASTGTKNPKYSDVLYLEALIGPETVNTVPPATLDAFRDHGHAALTLTSNVEEAGEVLGALAEAGISLDGITADLLEDGIRLFADAYEQLLNAIAKTATPAAPQPRINAIRYTLAERERKSVDAALDDWQANDQNNNNKVARLWKRDPSLWTNRDEASWMGWLGITEQQKGHLPALAQALESLRKESFAHVLLLGMGGSSLCPEVTALTFRPQPGFPRLHILDSTDPAQIRAVESAIDLARTLFIVASKSGSTLEPNIFYQYFFDRVSRATGRGKAASRFVAITDPGSKMQQAAEAAGFKHVFFGEPSIGGRYSALSNFGLVPMALAGVDMVRFLDRTEEMVQACAATVAARENPGVVLGAVLGSLANLGRDKVTLFASPAIFDIGAWLEQLLAESTGKQGKGLIPVDREAIADAAQYGSDRIFVYLRLDSNPDAEQDARIAALEQAGHPVVRIELADIYDLGQEYFRWEIATAVAGSIIGINPFDQPDVEASKVATRALTAEYERAGSLPAESPVFAGEGLQLFTDAGNWNALKSAPQSLEGILRAHLARLHAGDYCALLAYIAMNPEHEAILQRIRHRIRQARGNATCVGFGPRFLHSTGQAYKGGPNSGVFLQITCDDAQDIAVPGQSYTFGVVKAAQARGDFSVLAGRGRRALRVHLGRDVKQGLEALEAAVARALGVGGSQK